MKQENSKEPLGDDVDLSTEDIDLDNNNDDNNENIVMRLFHMIEEQIFELQNIVDETFAAMEERHVLEEAEVVRFGQRVHDVLDDLQEINALLEEASDDVRNEDM